MSIFNLYSALVMFLLLLGAGALMIVRRGNRRHEWAILGGLAVLGLAAWWGLRPVQSSEAGLGLESLTAQGKPVLLEFQSPY